MPIPDSPGPRPLGAQVPGALGVRFEKLAGGGVRVIVTGELDLVSAPLLDQALRAVDTRGGPLILDLREVSFCDSSGIHTVITAHRRARDSCQRLVVVQGPRQVRRVFALTGIDELLELVDDPALIAPDEPTTLADLRRNADVGSGAQASTG